MLKRILIVLATPLISFAQPAAREVASRAFSSTVLISVDDPNGQPLGIGSGFVLKQGVVATNFHVIEGASGGFVKLIGAKAKHEVTGILALSEKYDLAVLAVPSLSAPTVNLGDFSSVAVGDPVYAVGNPQGLEGTFSQGIVSAIRDVGGDRVLQITAPISPGSSGGPVLDAQGRVIGVSVATFRGGQNLNFAIPVGYLADLHAQVAGSPSPFKKISRANPKSSVLGNIGGDLREGVTGAQFTWNDNRFMGYYTFSIRNDLRDPIRNVLCAVIFYGKDELPIETETVRITGPVPSKLAKRTTQQGRLEADQVRNLTGRVEVRVLDFQVMNEQ